MSISRTVLGFAAALALGAALVPALASAQTNYYYGTNGYDNCYPSSTTYPYNYNQYPYNQYPYNSNYSNGNCQNRGMLFVYLQVNAPVGSYYGRQPNDFTISVSGGNAWPATIQGSPNGQLVSAIGSYSVTAASFNGFTPTYSSGCSGSLSQGQQNTCVITENPVYPYNYQYPYNQYQNPYYNTQPYVTPTVVVTPSYVPSLPNTGFEPVGAAGIAFAVVALLAAVLLAFPYVRKALAVILG